MDPAKIKHYLEMVTNVAVLLVAIVVLGTFAWNRFPSRREIQLHNGLQKGAFFTQLPGVEYNNSPQTLVIAMSSKCDFCNESIPFYRRLAEAQPEKNKPSRIVAIFPDAEDDVKQYTRQNGLDVNTISGIDFKALNLVATPTMILVDRDGKILDFWIGKLSQDAEQQIIKAMR